MRKYFDLLSLKLVLVLAAMWLLTAVIVLISHNSSSPEFIPAIVYQWMTGFLIFYVFVFPLAHIAIFLTLFTRSIGFLLKKKYITSSVCFALGSVGGIAAALYYTYSLFTSSLY